MGMSCHCLVLTGTTLKNVCDELSIRTTGETAEVAEAELAAMMLDDNRLALMFLDDDLLQPEPEVFSALSRFGSVASCNLHEGSMISGAQGWTNGEESWTVWHDAQVGPEDLRATGSPVLDLEAMKSEARHLRAESSDVDFFFDIPVKAFVAAGGFDYSRVVKGRDGSQWQVLERHQNVVPSSWIRRVLGLGGRRE